MGLRLDITSAKEKKERKKDLSLILVVVLLCFNAIFNCTLRQQIGHNSES